MEVRQMNFQSEFKTREQEDKKMIEGYFIVFNQETNLYCDVYEKIAPEAVQNSLSNNDIRCLFDHDSAKVLGRNKNHTLSLKADDYGLYGSVEVNENDREAMDIYERVKRGDIDSCSFGFYPLKEEHTERDDGSHLFTVKDADVIEVSVVTFPAYPQTQVSARVKEVDKLKLEKLNVRKNKMKVRLSNVFSTD